MDQRKRSEDLLNKLNEAYGDETFVSEGYSYFDDLAQAITFEFTRDAERIADLSIVRCVYGHETATAEGMNLMRENAWMAERVKELERIVKFCLQFDHDSDAHRYSTPCRLCQAERVMATTRQESSE